jgi:Tol biopolymer transport system component/DNA-binding winged helix-turn-helix (wHTH) protein
MPDEVVRFGDGLELDSAAYELRRSGRRLKLERIPLETLLLLVERRGQLVSRDDIIARIWGKDVFLDTDNSINSAIRKIRQVLKDDPENPIYIQTVTGKGYRFIAAVTAAVGPPSSLPVAATPQSGPSPADPPLPAQMQTDLPPLPLASQTGPLNVLPPAEEPGDVAIPPTVRPPATRNSWKDVSSIAIALLALAVLAATFMLHHASPTPPIASTQWEQLTFFTDSAVYPALSSDGRMLAFIRGSDSFIGPGDLYVELLPGGEPVQLTHDSKLKLAPSFSPDNSLIVYSVVVPWDTWVVPVLGGEPHLLLPNSSSLTWIDGGKRLLFSEIKDGLHLAVVTTDQARGNSRDVYVPIGNRSMAHHSYLSPDEQWVLIVEMDSQGQILPCRVVPFQGPTKIKVVGPPGGQCRAGAWSPDGKWIYLTAKTDDFHLWRQRFPDGQPEQLTFGPTSQEGIAMAADGKSLITSVGSQDHTVWLHDKDGEHQISSEGDAWSPILSSDGRSLYFLMANGQTHGVELWVKDLNSGKLDRLLPGYSVQSRAFGRQSDYSLSQDGKQVAFAMDDQNGRSSIWVAPTDHRSSPRHISSAAVEDEPFFLPGGDLIFRAEENGLNFLYRMNADGTARRKFIPDRILELIGVSPDGRWILAAMPNADQQFPSSVNALAIDGGPSTQVCVIECHFHWDPADKFAYINFADDALGYSYVLPVMQNGLPKLPAGGIEKKGDLADAKVIPWDIGSVVNTSLYAYTRQDTRRNLYRIQLP